MENQDKATELDSSDAKSADPDESLNPSEKRLLIGLAVVGAAVLLVIVLFNVFGDDSPDNSDPFAQDGSSEQTSQDNAAAFSDGGGVAETPKQLAPTADPVVDDLKRDTLEGGPLTWEVLGEGGWSPDNGQLVTDSTPSNATPLGVVEVPTDLGAGWRFSIVVDSPANNAGLVFGVEDANNFWELTFNGDYAAAFINHVQEGEPDRVKVIAPTGFGNGVSWEVQHVGDTVTLASEGEPFFAVSDPSLEQPRKVGVIATSGAPAKFSAPQIAAVEGS